MRSTATGGSGEPRGDGLPAGSSIRRAQSEPRPGAQEPHHRGLLAALLCVALLCVVALVLAACGAEPPVLIGRAGLTDGAFRNPRGVAVSARGIAVLDRSGRLQIFDLDGTFERTIEIVDGNVRRGLPIGCAWLPDGRIAVADTHQSRVRLIDVTSGEETVLGQYGLEPGHFLYPQRITTDAAGRMIVSDHGMGATNRIQRITDRGVADRVFGGPDPEDGGLARPMGVVVLPDGSTLVADQRAGIVRFDAEGALVGTLPGWPFGPEVLAYGLARGDDGTLYCSDLVGHQVLRLAPDGTPTGVLGREGTTPGTFREPWDVAWFGGHLYVADMGNNRIQRFDAENADWRAP